VNGNGRGPWTYRDYLNSLSQGMAAAHTPADWLNLIPIAAAMAHYIEDLHNPLHLTKNYDGQLSGNNGVHSRYESSMVSRHFDGLAITTESAVHLPSVIDFVFDGIDDRYHYVADIMAADTSAPTPKGSTAYYDYMWAQTGAFTHDLFQDASLAVASSWYTAWVNAGSPRTFLNFAGDFEGDGDLDAADLNQWRTSFDVTTVADANSSGQTDGADFLLWQSKATYPLPIASAVPEPATVAQLGAAVFLSAWALRRRNAR
jgi:hypothetical protein